MNKKWALIPTLPILEIHPTSTADFSKEDKFIFWDHKAKTLKTPNTGDFSNKADDNQQINIYGWTINLTRNFNYQSKLLCWVVDGSLSFAINVAIRAFI